MKKILFSITALLLTVVVSGQSWVAQNTGFSTASRGIIQIHILDANNIWGLAYDGAGAATDPEIQEFTKTTNGGSTWTPGFIDIANAGWKINNIIPISSSVAWVSAIDLTGGGTAPTPGGIWKTTNGGTSWTRQLATAFIGSGAFINGVHFWDANEGIAFGDPVAANKIECYKTTDGGTSWTSLTTVPTMSAGEYNYNNGNVFIGNSIWLPTNKGKILYSNNKGATWSKLNSPLTDFGSATVSGSLYFSDATNGVLLGTLDSGATYKLYTTSNGGISWITPAANYAGGFNRILSYVPGTTTLVACGLNATSPAIPGSSYSNNNGLTFTQIDTGAQRGFVKMLDGSTGWCSGFNAVSGSGVSTGGIFKLSGSLSTDQFSSTKSFIVSPNPTTGLVSLQSSGTFSSTTVYDILGKIVVSATYNNVKDATIDLTKLQAGTYFLKVISENKAETVKILKQ